MDDLFVSNVDPEHWEPDPEVPGSEMHELVRTDGIWAGLTRFPNRRWADDLDATPAGDDPRARG